jgi:hypothetical protein
MKISRELEDRLARLERRLPKLPKRPAVKMIRVHAPGPDNTDLGIASVGIAGPGGWKWKDFDPPLKDDEELRRVLESEPNAGDRPVRA